MTHEVGVIGRDARLQVGDLALAVGEETGVGALAGGQLAAGRLLQAGDVLLALGRCQLGCVLVERVETLLLIAIELGDGALGAQTSSRQHARDHEIR